MSIIKSAEVDWWNYSSLKKLIDAERERIIQCALDTPEGKLALAQVMVEPIQRALEYQAIDRRLMMVDELPQGALARYERDVENTVNQIVVSGGLDGDLHVLDW